MSIPLKLGIHPGERHVRISKSDPRALFFCAKCNDDTVEPASRPTGRAVKCDRCGQPCQPKMVCALPNQHGIWIGGREECDPENKQSLIAAGYKCVGYCMRERDAEVWYTEQVDPYLVGQVNALIGATYGSGDTLVHLKPDVDFPDEDAPPDDDDIDDTDMEDDS